MYWTSRFRCSRRETQRRRHGAPFDFSKFIFHEAKNIALFNMDSQFWGYGYMLSRYNVPKEGTHKPLVTSSNLVAATNPPH